MRYGLLSLAALVSGLLSLARGDDWPQWLGPQRDGVWRETGLIEKFPAGGPPVRWRTNVEPSYAGPTVAGGRVFITDRVLAANAKNHAEPFPQRPREGIPGRERVHCLNDADGKLVWKHEYDCTYTVSYPVGPRASPVVHAGKLYTLGTEGHLICFDAATGNVVWSHDLKADYRVKAPIWGFSAHPLIDGQKLICMVGGDGSTVVAFDKDTGKELWKALSSAESGYCAPMIYEAGGQRQLVVWHGGAIAGLNPETGAMYWSEKVTAYRGMAIATPRKMDDLLFVTAYPDTALMLRLDTGRPAATVAWRGDKKTGLYSVFSTPFCENGHLYGISTGGRLCCVKTATGERLWETLDPLASGPLPSQECFLVKNGDRFVVANEKGDSIFARLSPKGYEEVSRTHLLDPTATAYGRKVLWCHPAFANRSIYWRNDKELVCFSLANPSAK